MIEGAAPTLCTDVAGGLPPAGLKKCLRLRWYCGAQQQPKESQVRDRKSRAALETTATRTEARGRRGGFDGQAHLMREDTAQRALPKAPHRMQARYLASAFTCLYANWAMPKGA